MGQADRLLAEAVGGNASACDRLIGPLVEPGYRLAFAMLGIREDAEDAVQEATISAWRSLHRLQNESAARSWFLAIVANRCRSTRRGRWWSVVKVAEPERQGAGPEDHAVERTDLQRALQRPPPHYRLSPLLPHYTSPTPSKSSPIL